MPKQTGLDLLKRGIKPSTRYRCVIEGEVFVQAEKGTSQEPYRAAFLTTERACREASPIFQFVNDPQTAVAMKRQFPKFLSIATHRLEGTTTENGKAIENPELMTWEEMVHFIKDMEIPVDWSLYLDRVDLLNAIKEHYEEPEAFAKNQETRRLTNSKRNQMVAELRELNPNGVTFLGFGDEAIDDHMWEKERLQNQPKFEPEEDDEPTMPEGGFDAFETTETKVEDVTPTDTAEQIADTAVKLDEALKPAPTKEDLLAMSKEANKEKGKGSKSKLNELGA